MTHLFDRTPRASARYDMPVRDVFGLVGINAFPTSIRSMLEDLSCWDQLRLIRRLDPATAAAIFQHLDPERKALIAAHLPVSRLSAMARHLPSLDQRVLCEGLPPARRAVVRKTLDDRPCAGLNRPQAVD